METNVQNAVREADNSLQRAFAKPSAQADKLGKEDFMKLLMAQVTNQDPLNPMDSQGMMDQLTSMGSLEQLVNINESLGSLHDTQRDIVRSNTFSFLDKDVTVRGGGVPVSNGEPAGMQFSIPHEAEAVVVNIVGPDGEAVRRMELGAHGSGTHAVPWDGLNNEGNPVADGFYRYNVAARSAEQEPVPVDLYVRGKVAGVRFEGGRPMLTVNGEDIDVRDIIEMSNRSQRIFGDRLPAGLQDELRPRAPATRLP